MNRTPDAVSKQSRICKRIWPLAGLGISLLCLALVFFPREPSYKGKRLSQWLEELNDFGPTNNIRAVAEAIQAMGPNVLPHLKRQLLYTESPRKTKLLAPLRRNRHLRRLVGDPARLYMPSLFALQALGTNAVTLVPELFPFINGEMRGMRCVMAFFCIGPAGDFGLEQACSSTNYYWRTAAADYLAMSMGGSRVDWAGETPASGETRLGFTITAPFGDSHQSQLLKNLGHGSSAVRCATAEMIKLRRSVLLAAQSIY